MKRTVHGFLYGVLSVLATTWPFIEVDERGIAFIRDTRIKVVEIVADHRAYRWDAEQIHRQHPHLALAQIHAALGYYYEHQDECDRQMDDALRQADAVCHSAENRALLEKLRSCAGE